MAAKEQQEEEAKAAAADEDAKEEVMRRAHNSETMTQIAFSAAETLWEKKMSAAAAAESSTNLKPAVKKKSRKKTAVVEHDQSPSATTDTRPSELPSADCSHHATNLKKQPQPQFRFDPIVFAQSKQQLMKTAAATTIGRKRSAPAAATLNRPDDADRSFESGGGPRKTQKIMQHLQKEPQKHRRKKDVETAISGSRVGGGSTSHTDRQ